MANHIIWICDGEKYWGVLDFLFQLDVHSGRGEGKRYYGNSEENEIFL